ncbi:hypothetical protein CF68_27585 [Cupriavidus sp. SK-4]|nr:hypothetical protein CF68_27585 [Cupriavidus sp. SK-4]
MSILGLVVMLDSAQVRGKWLATGRAFGLGVVFNRGLALGLLQLHLQTGLVFGQGLLKQAALLGAHRLGLGSELPCLESRQFEGDLLDLDVLELDLAFLLLDVCEHLLRQCQDVLGREVLKALVL